MEPTFSLLTSLTLRGSELAVRLYETVLEPANYFQLIWIAVSIVLAFGLAHYFRREPQRFARIQVYVIPTLLVIFISIGAGLSPTFKWGDHLLVAALKLIVAAALISVMSRFIKDKTIARILAFILLLLVAMSLMGWLQPLIQQLSSYDIQFGKIRISAFDALRGALTLLITLWLAAVARHTTDKQLQKSRFSPSTRVLFGKLASILFYMAAILISLSAMGIDLMALTVFSGALGVGIGLGLQRVVANFVSGIILLMEKAVKPGDVVEVGTMVGRVVALNARYVSVDTYDGREHLIPNEQLITQTVVNWSYSNDLIRNSLMIGVPYENDPARVIELLLAAAGENPRILKKPAPQVFMLNLDNLLNFELIYWIKDPSSGLKPLKSELYLSIFAKFREEGVILSRPPHERWARGVTLTPEGKESS